MNDDAARLRELESAVRRALALLDEGRAQEARRELAAGMAPADSMPLADAELEAAFASAQPETDQMLDADRVAQDAIRQADRELAREARGGDDLAEPFATESMAELLERQGDSQGAARIRSAIDTPPAAERPGRTNRQRVIATLEHWLDNVRGGPRA